MIAHPRILPYVHLLLIQERHGKQQAPAPSEGTPPAAATRDVRDRQTPSGPVGTRLSRSHRPPRRQYTARVQPKPLHGPFPPDANGWFDMHCERCYHLVRARSLGAVGFRCRRCAGAIRPGTPTQFDAWKKSRQNPPAKPDVT